MPIITLPVYDRGILSGARESIDVQPLEDGTYRLMRSPGLIAGLARGDVIVLQDAAPRFAIRQRGGYVCVWYFHPEAASRRENLDPALRHDVERIGGAIDGGTSFSLVISVPASAGFGAIEAAIAAAVERDGRGEWYYGNVYDPIDEVTPLRWWV